MFERIKQLKQLRDQANQMKTELASERMSASSRDSLVTITLDGNQNIVALDIHPDLLQPDKKTVLEENIKEAHQRAIEQIRVVMMRKLREGGISLPGLGV